MGLKIPTVEVRYKNVCIEAECDVVEGEPLPTLWNTLKRIIFVSFVSLSFFEAESIYSTLPCSLFHSNCHVSLRLNNNYR